MKLIAKLRGHRTMIVAALMALAPFWDILVQVLPVLAADPDLPKLIPPHLMPLYSLAVTIVMIWMRVITSTKWGARE